MTDFERKYNIPADYDCPYCRAERMACSDEWEGCELEDSIEYECPECGLEYRIVRTFIFHYDINPIEPLEVESND